MCVFCNRPREDRFAADRALNRLGGCSMSPGSSTARVQTALTPVYNCPGCNEPFPVYKGPVEVVQVRERATGQIEAMWTWFPLPEIGFMLDIDPRANFQLGDCLV